jgi:ectoine hydroxylase-related dioxygenase (phytanoyl-CoA dioxygenase family)
MAEVTHLPGNSSVADIIDVVERDGAAIVDDFVSQTFLNEFNSAVQTSIDDYTPYDYGEEEANEFLGYQTVRLNGIASMAPCYIDLITDERLLGVMDHFLKPNCGQYLLNSSEVIEIHGGETAQELHVDDMIWPVFNWVQDRLLQFNVMVAGTDCTEENGATQIVPGSHKWGDDLWREVKPEEIARATMKAGSAVFIPGRTLHGGGANTSGEIRRAIVASYILGFLRTQENHFLHTSVDMVAKMPPRARQLLGYDLYSHYADGLTAGPLGYYKYGSPAVLFNDSDE